MLPDFIPTTEAGLLPCTAAPHLYDHPDTQPEAAALCTDCPVRTACDTWAVQHAEWGTWAGRTDNDRGTPRTELPDTPRLPAAPNETCGTEAARRQHIGRQEVCIVCDMARADRVRTRRLATLDVEHQRPGGPSREGYRLHLKLKVQPCGPCREAHRLEIQEWRAGGVTVAA